MKWPWSYEEFLPYFERAERSGVWPATHPIARTFATGLPVSDAAVEAAPVHRFPEGYFLSAGLGPYIGARAINSQTFEAAGLSILWVLPILWVPGGLPSQSA